MRMEINNIVALTRAAVLQKSIYETVGYDPRDINAVNRVTNNINGLLEKMSMHDSLSGKFILAKADDTVDHKLKSNILNGADITRWCMAIDDFKKVAGAMGIKEFGGGAYCYTSQIDTDNILTHDGDKYRIYFQL